MLVCVTNATASLLLVASSLAANGVAAPIRSIACAGGALVVVGGEQPVQRLARVGEQLPGLRDLALGARAQDLVRGHRDLPDETAHVPRRVAHGAGEYVPGCPELVGMGFDVGTALVGELIGPAATFGCLGPDQPLVLELLQRRVDRARAGPPHAV